ncbi:ATP-binding cassette domain-containing protein [Marinomonas algicola]|uniref:ATP-binding cassette domain-containing protein n=1 Tax=Marinomonas algicola TaxID=2773454 RepID=UPI0023D91429|nr:ATP-binding cassette domain-containing protein [Marinomonas algicola]
MDLDKSLKTEPILEVNNLKKTFNDIEVLKGIHFTADKGDVVALIGGSGSGKSTTLRCINMLETPTAGDIKIFGQTIDLMADDANGLKVKSKNQLRNIRQRIGMVFQGFHLWSHLTIEQNIIEVPTQVLAIPKDQAIEEAHEWLRQVNLFDKRHQYPSCLSGGQQQRAAIARALAINPDLMLFDEPTSALDPELVGEVLAVMKDLASEGRSMIIVTHEMQFAADVANKVLFLNQGVVEESGTPSEIFYSPKSEKLKQFIRAIK